MSHVKWIHNDIKVCNYKPGFSEALLDSYIVHVINRKASKKKIYICIYKGEWEF